MNISALRRSALISDVSCGGSRRNNKQEHADTCAVEQCWEGGGSADTAARSMLAGQVCRQVDETTPKCNTQYHNCACVALPAYLAGCLVNHSQARGVLCWVVVHLLHCWVAQEGINLLLDVEGPAGMRAKRAGEKVERWPA